MIDELTLDDELAFPLGSAPAARTPMSRRRIVGLVVLLAAIISAAVYASQRTGRTVEAGAAVRLEADGIDPANMPGDGSFWATAVMFRNVTRFASWTGVPAEDLESTADIDAAAEAAVGQPAQVRKPRAIPNGVPSDSRVAEALTSAEAASRRYVPEGANAPLWKLDRLKGASLGLIAALADIDAAGPGALTGGLQVAGTGTISSSGRVGPIAGAAVKADAAAQLEGDVFFVPSSDATEARIGAGGRITVVAVDSLRDAVAWLCGHGADDIVCGTI